MRAVVNVRHLECKSQVLNGQLTVEELDIDLRDELISVKEPLAYEIEVQKVEDGLLAQGRLELRLDCQCSRCLKAHQQGVLIEDWVRHFPYHGEEQVAIINDQVDLTPYLREDIVLAFPQRPLCEPECQGLGQALAEATAADHREAGAASPAWAALNKLKL